MKIDYGKQLNMTLCEHITNNQLNFKFVSFDSPRLAFTQIFQLKGYGQYGMHGSIVNVRQI
jgi:hypothetical protein